MTIVNLVIDWSLGQVLTFMVIWVLRSKPCAAINEIDFLLLNYQFSISIVDEKKKTICSTGLYLIFRSVDSCFKAKSICMCHVFDSKVDWTENMKQLYTMIGLDM